MLMEQLDRPDRLAQMGQLDRLEQQVLHGKVHGLPKPRIQFPMPYLTMETHTSHYRPALTLSPARILRHGIFLRNWEHRDRLAKPAQRERLVLLAQQDLRA